MKKSNFFDRDFKVNAVKLAIESDRFKAAKELGISIRNINRWQAEFQKYGTESFPGRTAEQIRLSVLKANLTKKLKKINLQIEILNSASKYIPQGRAMIFHFIEHNLYKYSLSSMCEVFGTRGAEYHKWKNKILTQADCRRIAIEKEITSIFYEYKGMYGNGKIAAELQSRGIKLSISAVTAHMKRLGLVSKHSGVRKDKFDVTVNPHNPCILPNVLNQNFKVETPSKVWVSGITSLETEEGLLFLTIIMDLYDRKIIGWNLSERLITKESSTPAWKMAVKNRKISKGLIFHSNRSFVYANNVFTRKLASYKCIKQSMSRAGNQLDNSVPRIFFASLKSDLVNLDMLLTKKDMAKKISEYIQNLY